VNLITRHICHASRDQSKLLLLFTNMLTDKGIRLFMDSHPQYYKGLARKPEKLKQPYSLSLRRMTFTAIEYWLAIAAIVALFFARRVQKNRRLPPGPGAFSFLGNIFSNRPRITPWTQFKAWSQQLGIRSLSE
jgi:hypothetical protein